VTEIVPSSSQSLDQPRSFTSDRGVTIEALIQAWLHAKNQLSESPKTRKAYETTINAFRAFLQDKGYDLIWQGDDFVPLVADFAQAFVALRSSESRRKGTVTSTTRAQRLAILSSFYLYAIRRRHIATGNPIDSVDRPKVEAYGKARGLPPKEVARRLRAIDTSTLQGARDLAILAVSVTTGRRVSEIADLTREMVARSGESVTLSFPRTKGNKSITDTLPPNISKTLLNWLDRFYEGRFFEMPNNTPLWVNVRHTSKLGTPLGYHGFQGIAKHYLGTTKFHVTRHSFALLMDEVGAKLTDIQQRLQHDNPATTGGYMQKLTQDRNEYADKISDYLGLDIHK
jgi:site-specific recombinase XerD